MSSKIARFHVPQDAADRATGGAAVAAHPYLSGVHTPIPDERSLEGLRVDGVIPPQLNGVYARIGPNPYAPNPDGYHWFTGDGMVHGVRLEGGRAAWYRNRYIRSRALEAAGGPAAAPGPRRGITDLVNTNIISFAGEILAISEVSAYPAALDGGLETRAYTDFAGTLAGPFSAHPHEDPRTGELHAITYDAMTPDTVWHVVVQRDGRVSRELAIEVQHGPSIHDCALTANYVVVFDLPVTFSFQALGEGARFPYRWNPAHAARVGLLPRHGTAGDIIWCAVDPCYVFHVVNSYEDADGRVVIDAAVHETMFAGGAEGPNGRALGLERWIADPRTGRVTRETIDAAPQEFPRPDERYLTQPYRHAWAVAIAGEGEQSIQSGAALYHHDVIARTRSVHHFGPHCLAGEFVFVPRAADAPEGDGFAMGFVIDTQSRSTRLVILDAQAIAAAPLAVVHIPHIVPQGFHGNFLPDQHCPQSR